MNAVNNEDIRVRWCTVAMAALATIALEQAVLEPGRSQTTGLLTTNFLLLIPTFVASWCFDKTVRSWPRSRFTEGPAVFMGILILFALPFLWNGGCLVITGHCLMLELVLLSALRNLGIGLAIVSCRRFFSRLSTLVSLFLVTVAVPIGGESGVAVMLPVAGFAIVGTFWLMLVNWNRLQPVDDRAEQSTRRLPAVGIAWVIGIVALLGTILVVGPSRAATTLAGLMPTSGGTDWSDPDARSGVGDGDNEVSASENPQSIGFTESEVYLETDRPSLYDAFNESYGEPFKPRKQEKTIALGQQNVTEQQDRPAENLQAGREFSAVRRKSEPRQKRPSERVAKALVYVKGPTPLHLPLMAYSHFDGRSWREEPCCSRDLAAEQEPGGNWLRIPIFEPSFLSGAVAHQIKVGTLNSSPMPLPSHLRRFRVGSINRSDFFGWAQFGIVRMTDRTVPSGTVIDSVAMTVDPRRLEATPFAARQGETEDHNLSFRGSYSFDPVVADLARQWVSGVTEGWPQVEAVVDALRRDYVHDHSARSTENCGDVVAEFLLRTRRGPDYLFATAAAVLLRSLGYPTRVVSGLYATPTRFDPRTRHTPVTRDDVHFWAEVRHPSGFWVAVEPTPGYELLPPVLPWSEQLAQALGVIGSWVGRQALGLGLLSILLVFAAMRRREFLDSIALLAFRYAPCRDARHRVIRALRLVERRARWAGCARPPGATPHRWYRPVADRLESPSALALRDLIRLADWAAHAPSHSTPFDREEPLPIDDACRVAIRDWTITRFREAAPNFKRKVMTT